MQLVSMRCPNCNGVVRQTGEGRFLCESCGTSFMADYDKEDLEYQRQRVAPKPTKAQSTRPYVVLAVVLVSMIVLSITVMGVVVGVIAGNAGRRANTSHEDYLKRQQEREEKSRAAEEEASRSRESSEQAAAESRAAMLASYDIVPEDLLADEFFVENASKALLGQLENNNHLYYTNFVWNEQPEYMTSYLLIAKDEDNTNHNVLVNLYKVHWDKKFEDRTDQYIMYDSTCLYNLSKNEDGTIKTDYTPHPFSTSSEIVANQLLHGYSDYEQLIRQEIYGNSDYRYIEFQFRAETEDGGGIVIENSDVSEGSDTAKIKE